MELYTEGLTLKPEEESCIRNAVLAALKAEGREGEDLTVLVSTEERIRELNRDYRHVDRVTDVLTFPAWEGEELLAPPDGYLGDIMICYKRALVQAEEYGHTLARELAFLAVHGVLHLLGYDHMQEDEEREMRDRQRTILEGMGLEIK